MSWDLEELRNLVKHTRDEDQLAKIKPHLDNVAWKISISNYHHYTSKNAFDSFFNDSENNALQAFKLLFGASESSIKFDRARLVAEANAIACAQHMHSISDVLAHTIYHSLKSLDLDENDVSLVTISRSIDNGPLKDEIVKLLGCREFCYIKDFVNTTKHHSLVFSEYSVNLENLGKEEHGMKFKSFSYTPRESDKAREHKEKTHYQILNELEKLVFRYTSIGKELNKYVAQQT